MYNVERLKLMKDRASLALRAETGPNHARRKILARRAQIRPATDASNRVATAAGKTRYYATQMRQSAQHVFRTGELPKREQGKGAKHASHLDNPDVKKRLVIWSNGLVDKKDGGYEGRMRPEKLLRFINDFLFPELGIAIAISVSTAVRWLKKLGYKRARYAKGVYYDGHERVDVVKKRNELLNYLYLEILPYVFVLQLVHDFINLFEQIMC